ncbi:DUF1566 domain-containing protein [Leptospira stimsonii]|uniref:DUF1566 domain-containing protein n=1 Tax=Leptospira stimsonii TaxID=2202203 RepID=A0A4R9L6K0_9LEPT|nr:DUF1566 domain-containing protein [Leptospira stimsonii]RHX88575.1 hypothetical protein DLM78_06480 [Leptospira stimsonii]TGK22929.1 DUF1566 domain-containing protein [Leptospira stimsonii]TGM16637.1 DUF1566 domain-containing protein [Leptospira stimsonii]
MFNFRILALRFFFSLSILIHSACYLNPYFRDLVSQEDKKESPLALLLLFVGAPIIKGDVIFFPQTGLSWMRCTLGQTFDPSTNTCTTISVAPIYCSSLDNQCNGNLLGGVLSSGPAFDACAGFSSSNATGSWRVPTHLELKSIVSCSNGTDLKNFTDTQTCGTGFDVPTIRKDWFPGTPTNNPIEFWSSTSDPSNATFAWKVNFSTGATNLTAGKNSSGYLRCVAGSP